MFGDHINKKSKYKSFYIFGILISVFLIALASNIVLNIGIGFGADSSDDETIVYNDAQDPDMNYGTKEYWDTNFGPHDSLYLTSLSPGQTLGEEGQITNYFIADDIDVTGTNCGSAVNITGAVNLYFEAKDNQTDGPTLTTIGGNSTGQTGAGAGIQIREGSSLRVYGRGFINATGGSVTWNPNEHTPANAGNGRRSAFGFYSGSGAGGAAGSGGAGAAIGTGGANGGKGAPYTPGLPGDVGSQVVGTDGEDGSNGDKSGSVGLLKISGNIVLTLKAGQTSSKLNKLTRSKAGGNVDSVDTVANGGGGGGYGGLGWDGVLIGSGGAGAGGGGAGGAGSVAYDLAYYYRGTGGGGGAGASKISLTNSGGGINVYEDSHYTHVATVGEDCVGTIFGKDSSCEGGIGSWGGRAGCGDGGRGGQGGVSGSQGLWKSSSIDQSMKNSYEDNYSPGRDADQVRCFPTTELRPKSLVDWCVALKSEYYQVRDLSLIHFPTGQQLFPTVDFYPWWNNDGIITNLGSNFLTIGTLYDEFREYIVTLDDMETSATTKNTRFDVWLVSKGVVDIDIPDEQCSVDYNGKSVDVYSLSTMTFNDENVKDEIDPKDVEIVWYKYNDQTKVKLDSAPKDAGDYCVQITVKDTQYIGRCIKDFTIKQITAKGVVLNYVKKIGQIDPEFKCEWYGLLDKEVFVERKNATDPETQWDYYIEREPGEEIGQYDISIHPSPVGGISIKNYDLDLTDGILIIKDGKLASITVKKPETPIRYGDQIPKFTLIWGGLDPGDEFKMREDTDYKFIYDYANKNVGIHKINVEPIYSGPISKKYVFETYGSELIIKPKSASLIVNPAYSTYGDKTVNLSAYAEGLIYPEALTESDYDISREDGTEADTYKITAIIIEDGPIAKNYDWSGSKVAYGVYTIKQFDDFEHAAFSNIDDVIYSGNENKPSFIVSYTFVSGEAIEFNKDIDYDVEYSDNINAGECIITITGKGKNCSSESTGSTTFTINKLDASATCDDKEVEYGQQPNYSLTTVGVIVGEILKYEEDFLISGAGEDVDTYEITAEIIPTGPVSRNYNFGDITSGSLIVNPFDFAKVEVEPVDPSVYTGREIRPHFFVFYNFPEMQNSTIQNNIKIFDEGKDYYVTYKNNINVGTATALLHGQNNCTNEKQVTFQIVEPAPNEQIYVTESSPTGDNMLVTIVVLNIVISACALTIYIRSKKFI